MTRAATLGLAALAIAAPLAGQSPTRAAGTVVKPGAGEGTPIPDVRVVLHRVGAATQGPVDTALTDRAGRFQFAFRADTTANYLVSARHAGIEYFSAPLATSRPDTTIRLLVYDTSSTAPVATRSRTLVIGAPDPTGSRTVIDWLVLENRGTTTRVGRDSADATWFTRLPDGARGPDVGDTRLTQISREAVTFRDDTAFVAAPLSPGQKELLIQYEMAGDQRSLELPAGPVDSMDLFIEEAGLRPDPAHWAIRDSQMFEGRPFRRYQRLDQAPLVSIRFPRTSLPTAVLPALVTLVGAALFGGAWLRMRRSGVSQRGGGRS